MSRRTLLWCALGAAALAPVLNCQCTDAHFVPVPEPDPVDRDDRIEVRGEFCTTDPETLNFPVKVMFIVDRSQSMNVTDPDVNIAQPGQPPAYAANRVRALMEAIDVLSQVVGLEVAIVGFGASTTTETEDCDDYGPPRVNCQPGFTEDVNEMRSGAIRTGNPGGGNTDFVAALTTAYTTLFRDMIKLNEQDAGNARYVIIFLSDGLADLDAEDADRGISIQDVLDDIMELKKRFRLADVTFNTALLSAGITQAQVYDVARSALSSMANTGKGVFRDFRNGGEINFLSYDVTTYRRIFTLKTLLVANLNAKPGLGDDITDSDADGLTDSEEAIIGTDPTLQDTDGDYFSDALEHNLRTSGLDPLDPADGDCTLDVDRQDTDGDELRDCEERYLGVRPQRYDTDFDGVPDRVETWFGTLATVDDLAQDLDFDGSDNGNEIIWHSNPRSNDSANLSSTGYRYKLESRGLRANRYCYEFKVGNVRLASTRASEAGPRGQNRVMVYVTEVPLDDPVGVAIHRVGCANARYDAEADAKFPPNGVITMTEEDLHLPKEFDPQVHCKAP